MQKLLVIFALLFANQAFTQTDNCTSACPSIGKKADYCYCIPELSGKSVQFADKDSKMYFANSAKAKPLAITIPKDASVSSMISMMKSVKFKFKPEDVLLIQAAIPKWETARKNIGYMVTASGLAYKVSKEGTGKLPEKGKKVKVNYKGYLEDGTVFDSSFERKQPIEFTLGVGQVIKGWDEGIMLFKVGGSGTLKIPSELGYGKTGAGQLIPPNATLYFDIEVVNAD